MSDSEKVLLRVLEGLSDPNARAIALQSYIAEFGPLSKEAGIKVRRVLRENP